MNYILIHQPTLDYCRGWLAFGNGNVPLYLIKVFVPSLVSLGLAVVIYQVFSLPILRWGRNKTRQTAPRPAQASTTSAV